MNHDINMLWEGPEVVEVVLQKRLTYLQTAHQIRVSDRTQLHLLILLARQVLNLSNLIMLKHGILIILKLEGHWCMMQTRQTITWMGMVTIKVTAAWRRLQLIIWSQVREGIVEIVWASSMGACLLIRRHIGLLPSSESVCCQEGTSAPFSSKRGAPVAIWEKSLLAIYCQAANHSWLCLRQGWRG